MGLDAPRNLRPSRQNRRSAVQSGQGMCDVTTKLWRACRLAIRIHIDLHKTLVGTEHHLARGGWLNLCPRPSNARAHQSGTGEDPCQTCAEMQHDRNIGCLGSNKKHKRREATRVFLRVLTLGISAKCCADQASACALRISFFTLRALALSSPSLAFSKYASKPPR